MFHQSNVSFSCCVIFAANTVCFTYDIADVTSLRAVTRHVSTMHVLTYYQSFSEQRLSNERPSEPINYRIVKKKLCNEIFGSHYFRALLGKFWVDTDRKEIREELENSYPQIFERIFEKVRTRFGDFYKYTNSQRRYKVGFHVNNENIVRNEYEFMFVCPVRDRESKVIMEYHVTRAYNMNVAINAPPIAGRFVLAFDAGNVDGRVPVMNLIAIADDSAKTTRILRMIHLCEAFYVVFRRGYSLTPLSQMDPICSLPDADKLRLCASLFAAREFKYQLAFLPLEENVQTSCVKKEILIVGRVGRWIRRWFSDERQIYEEWTIGCAVWDRGSGAQVTYYVSRGKGVNSIFVYTSSDLHPIDQVLVYHLASNVSVADARIRDNEQDGRFLANDVED